MCDAVLGLSFRVIPGSTRQAVRTVAVSPLSTMPTGVSAGKPTRNPAASPGRCWAAPAGRLRLSNLRRDRSTQVSRGSRGKAGTPSRPPREAVAPAFTEPKLRAGQQSGQRCDRPCPPDGHRTLQVNGLVEDVQLGRTIRGPSQQLGPSPLSPSTSHSMFHGTTVSGGRAHTCRHLPGPTKHLSSHRLARALLIPVCTSRSVVFVLIWGVGGGFDGGGRSMLHHGAQHRGTPARVAQPGGPTRFCVSHGARSRGGAVSRQFPAPTALNTARTPISPVAFQPCHKQVQHSRRQMTANDGCRASSEEAPS